MFETASVGAASRSATWATSASALLRPASRADSTLQPSIGKRKKAIGMMCRFMVIRASREMREFDDEPVFKVLIPI